MAERNAKTCGLCEGLQAVYPWREPATADLSSGRSVPNQNKIRPRPKSGLTACFSFMQHVYFGFVLRQQTHPTVSFSLFIVH
jgi:hypothetical protein